MSSFKTSLTVSPLSDGVNWVLKDPFSYDVGELGSGDRIEVQRGFITDFASIPRLLWFVLPKWGQYGNAAVVHDYLYWGQARTRAEADKVMLEAMEVARVPGWQRAAIYHSVRLFGWLAWKHNKLYREAGENRVIDLDAGELSAGYVHRRPGTIESTAATRRPPIHTSISLESSSQPDRYVRHRGELGELTPLSSEGDRQDATFVVRQGLAGGDSISLESVSRLGCFLRHRECRIELQPPDLSSQFRKEASFTARPGLSGSGTSFESVDLPGFYLRHRGSSLWVDDSTGAKGQGDPTPEAAFHQDATFEVVPGRHQYVDPSSWYRLKTAFRGPGESLEGNHRDSPVHGGAAFMDRAQNVTGQMWRFEPEPDGLFFRLYTMSSKELCLEADFRRRQPDRSGARAHGSAAFMDQVRDVPGQYWMLVPAGGDLFRLQTKFRGPGESLEGNQAQSEVFDGATFLDKTQNVSGQLWRLEKQAT